METLDRKHLELAVAVGRLEARIEALEGKLEALGSLLSDVKAATLTRVPPDSADPYPPYVGGA